MPCGHGKLKKYAYKRKKGMREEAQQEIKGTSLG